MKHLLPILCAILPLFSPAWAGLKKSSAFNMAIARQRCTPPGLDELLNGVNEGMPEWGQSPETMQRWATKIYHSPTRLANRAYYDGKERRFHAPIHNKPVVVSLRLIESVTTHIETALAIGHVKHIMFSDMGHSHILIPMDIYTKMESTSLHASDALSYYYAHPRTKFLYHTAEQLKMLDENREPIDDRYLRQRYLTRNLMADNTNSGQFAILLAPPTEIYNTVIDYPGHRYGSGFHISANKNGCFPYYDKDNKLKYFDISPVGHFALRYDIESLEKKNP